MVFMLENGDQRDLQTSIRTGKNNCGTEYVQTDKYKELEGELEVEDWDIKYLGKNQGN